MLGSIIEQLQVEDVAGHLGANGRCFRMTCGVFRSGRRRVSLSPLKGAVSAVEVLPALP